MMIRGWHGVNQQAHLLPRLLLTVQRSPPCTSSRQLTWSPPRLGSKVTCPSSVRLPTRNWPCSTTPPSCQLWFSALLSIFNRRANLDFCIHWSLLNSQHFIGPSLQTKWIIHLVDNCPIWVDSSVQVFPEDSLHLHTSIKLHLCRFKSIKSKGLNSSNQKSSFS